MRDIGADILANDPKTQEILSARSAIQGNNALIEDGVVIAQLVAELTPLTEGRLTTGLKLDAALATDLMAHPDDRKDASIRLLSRLVRIANIGKAAVLRTSAAIVGAAGVLEAIQVIQVSPIFQQALASILRYLGF
jgi:hypothetical protein